MKNLTIRLETEKDYRAVEELTREAFWNVYKPGADEHYYVHQMRQHPDFIPELAFVLELDDKIIAASCTQGLGLRAKTAQGKKSFLLARFVLRPNTKGRNSAKY